MHESFERNSPETQQRLEKEKNIGNELLLLGIEKQEIKNSVNVEVEKLSFMEIYYGYSYMSMTTPNGYDTNCLLEKFQHLYFKLAALKLNFSKIKYCFIYSYIINSIFVV